MVTRLDRLFGLLLELQDGRVRTGSELAERFGVSLRTLYRDAATLVAEGIPLRAEAGVGYQLRPGFFLSPLDFTPEEAVVLRLGLAWMAGHTGGRWARQTQTAAAKVSAALGPRARSEADRLATLVTLFSEKRTLDLDDPRVRLCLKAVSERRTLALSYTSLKDKSTTDRIVEPLGLSYSHGVWYLDAWCRLRQGPRAFRFDRVEALTWHGQPLADRPPDPLPRQPRWQVVVHLPEAERRWVSERQHWAWVAETPVEGGVDARYATDDLNEFLPWLMSWGPRVRVRAPFELVSLARQAGLDLHNLLTDSCQ